MLADLQEALARLVLDAELRRRFLAGAELDELELAPDERASLRAIDGAALERVATSLLRKRRRAVEASVPHTARLWPELGQRYVALLGASPARIDALDPALGPGLSELVRAFEGLATAARLDPGAPAWIVDLLGLELARACSRRDGELRTLRCRYPVHELLLACDRGWLGATLELADHEYRVEPDRLRWRATP